MKKDMLSKMITECEDCMKMCKECIDMCKKESGTGELSQECMDACKSCMASCKKCESMCMKMGEMNKGLDIEIVIKNFKEAGNRISELVSKIK